MIKSKNGFVVFLKIFTLIIDSIKLSIDAAWNNVDLILYPKIIDDCSGVSIDLNNFKNITTATVK